MNVFKTVLALMTAAMTACSGVTMQTDVKEPVQTETVAEQASTQVESRIGDGFAELSCDFDVAEAENATAITFENGTVRCVAESVLAEGQDVTITEGGVYLLGGASDNASVTVDAKGELVKLLLDGVDISKEGAPAIYIKKAETVELSLMPETQNRLSDYGTYTYAEGEDEPDAAVFSKADLIINGSGSLEVCSEVKNAIKGKDTVVFAADTGKISVKAKGNGIMGKDHLTILGGTFEIDAENHGLRSTEKDDELLGYIRICGGTFTINAGDTAINAENEIYIEGGSFDIISAGGTENAPAKADNAGFGAADGFGGMRNGESFGKRQGGAGGEGNVRENRPDALDDGTHSENAATERHFGGEMKFENMPADVPASGFGEGRGNRRPMGNGNPMGNENQTANQPPEAGSIPDGNFPTDIPQVPSEMPENGFGGGRMQGFFGEESEQNDGEAADEDSVGKGLKAEKGITIVAGSFVIDAADDAIHSNGFAEILGGEFEIKTADDAFHAENNLSVTDANIKIVTCYEGIEAEKITINSGNIDITATDDGINSVSSQSDGATAPAKPGNAREGVETIINGGSININAGFDGIDSNGSITLNGGRLIISCRGGSGDGAVDPDGQFVITAGELLASGASSLMGRAVVSEGMTYTVVNTGKAVASGTSVSICDNAGNVIFCQEFEKDSSSFIIISDALTVGEQYEMTFSGTEIESVSFTATLSPTPGNRGASGATEGFGGFSGGKGNRTEMPAGPMTEGIGQ